MRALNLFLVALILAAPAAGQDHALLLKRDGGWLEWWRPETRTARWSAESAVLADRVEWSAAAEGVDHAQIVIRRADEPWRVGVVLVRVDPERVALRLTVPPRRSSGFAGRWTVDDAPDDAVVALNAGHFTGGPWGWVVQNGRPVQAPGRGRLAPGVAVFATGEVAIVPVDSLPLLEGVVEGFQSYPALLEGAGDVPPELLEPGRGVDLEHRDGRMALCVTPEGLVILALTRLEGLGGLLQAAPFGPTTPEMAAVMGALGCVRAVLLDGGLSSQLLLRSDDGTRTWPGLRQVAAGLIAVPRPAAVSAP